MAVVLCHCVVVFGAAVASNALLPSRADALNDPGIPDAVESAADVDLRYTVCLGCHSKCGAKVRVQDDTILKVDGNPWHPNCAETGERLDWGATLAEGAAATGTMCPKGQAGPQVMYNPYRIPGPIKRVGARGAGQWESISWDQALTEIADILRPYFEGYDTDTLIPTADGSDTLGTIANQVVFSPGRFQHGQKEWTDRLFGGGFGTKNARHDHTSICETSHHVAGAFFTERFLPSQKDNKHHWKPNMERSDYVLWFGTSPLEANFPGQTLAKRTAKSRNSGTQHVIIDPRHSRSAAFAHRWLPVKVGGDGALALGIARRIIDEGNHDVPALQAANFLAARSLGHYEASDATSLIMVGAPTPEETWVFARDGDDYQIVDRASGAVTVLVRGSDEAAQFGRIELAGTEADAVTAEAAGLDARVVGDHVIDLGGGYYAAPGFGLERFEMPRDGRRRDPGTGSRVVDARPPHDPGGRADDDGARLGRQVVAIGVPLDRRPLQE